MRRLAEQVTGPRPDADDEAEYRKCAEKFPLAFERVERARKKQGAGPLFNGAKYSLVDAADAPFLERSPFLDRIRPIGLTGQDRRLKAWADTPTKRPSTHCSRGRIRRALPPNVKRRNKWLSQFVAGSGCGGGGVKSVQICIGTRVTTLPSRGAHRTKILPG